MLRRTCDWCHEEADECFCGAVDLSIDPEDIAFGFHIETIPDDEEDECL